LERELQTPDYAAILADMEAKKVALENAITALRAALVAGLLGASGDFQGSPNASSLSLPGVGADLPRGAFLGMSAGPAIKLYLSTIRKKQTNKEIAQALQDGGLASTGNFDNYITSALFRLKKDGAVLRFDDGWGLSEWYNEAFRTKLGMAKPPNGKKSAKRASVKPKPPKKKAAAEQPKALVQAPGLTSETKTVVHTVGIDSRVRTFLDARLPGGETVPEIAARLPAAVGVVNFSLVRLMNKAIVRRGEDGKYYAVKEPQ
jgi:hypothetical protein